MNGRFGGARASRKRTFEAVVVCQVRIVRFKLAAHRIVFMRSSALSFWRAPFQTVHSSQNRWSSGEAVDGASPARCGSMRKALPLGRSRKAPSCLALAAGNYRELIDYAAIACCLSGDAYGVS